MRAAALMAGFGLAAGSGAAGAATQEALADPASDLIVSVYRSPHRNSGSFDLNNLNGFALVTETRLVRLPAGVSRVRFEGVADGIEPVSALVTGFNGAVIEKNRDARLLSPSALVAASVGKRVELLRTNRKTGKTERLQGTILSDAGGGVVFKTDQGIEALRCSGLSETFSFEPATDLSARPTLSVEVRSPRAMTQSVTLSYLARGFDWAADYTANLSADGARLDLGAWVTLANSNSVGFPSAHTQVIAGRVNREQTDAEPAINAGFPIYASCWPQGTTSDQPAPAVYELYREERMFKKSAAGLPVAAPAAMAMREVVLTANRVQQEQLGDLKLYRVPERTTLASRQSKQVRLMDRLGIPVDPIYGVDFATGSLELTSPAHRLLRTKNSVVNHLGLPLPSGTVAVFASYAGDRLLEHESALHDTAVDEELEIDMGESSDVQVSMTHEKTSIDSAHAQSLPLVPGVSLRTAKVDNVQRVEVSNARNAGIDFELRLQIPEGARVVRADHPLGTKNGRPIFRFKVPANQTVMVRFQTQGTGDGILRTP
ncbi:MAG TPA: hypothetical protein VGN99_03275 [Steroidobacteraceae bacterium]|jgi:hypothetical protein|nr:hypothetical protein [Steroidobacteraceae bacterium]